jgi:CRISPR/Cas system CSM-associated protein Csm2 small subunit
MAEEVERLVVTPFREILEKANIAVENAKDADEDVAATMLKAAQSLAKEGERAMRRIEPLCKKNYDEYGSSFVDKIKEDGKLNVAEIITTTIGD